MVLIGTNNLGAHFDVASTVEGIQAVVTWLLEHTQGASGCIGKETGKACVFFVARLKSLFWSEKVPLVQP